LTSIVESIYIMISVTGYHQGETWGKLNQTCTPDMNRISHRTTQVDSVDLVSSAYDLDVILPDA
jgi:hypothetical protein